MNGSRRWLTPLVVALLVIGPPTLAQQTSQPTTADSLVTTRPVGRFLADSLRIGAPVGYALTFRHAPGQVVVFPDSGYNFAPFELVSKQFFATRTDDRGSLDSVVYALRWFGVAPRVGLSLPVFVVSEQDSLALAAPTDSVALQPLIRDPLDSLALRATATYAPLPRPTNLLGWLLGGAVLLVLAGGAALAFGQPLRRRFLLYRLQQRHQAFVAQFGQLQRADNQPAAVAAMERGVVVWKKYLETLGDRPYSTYTTKEMVAAIPDPALNGALHQIDRTIYGGVAYAQTTPVFQTLGDFAAGAYQRRRQDIMAGKK